MGKKISASRRNIVDVNLLHARRVSTGVVAPNSAANRSDSFFIVLLELVLVQPAMHMKFGEMKIGAVGHI